MCWYICIFVFVLVEIFLHNDFITLKMHYPILGFYLQLRLCA